MEKFQHLPSELQREVVSYMIPDPNNIKFSVHHRKSNTINTSYSLKYEVAYFKNTVFTPFRIEDVPFKGSNGSKPFISAPKTGILNENWCKVKNKNSLFLSRIPKKNGKHRYYITKEIIKIDEYETEYDEYGDILYYNYNYKSKYVGKNLKEALLILFTM